MAASGSGYGRGGDAAVGGDAEIDGLGSPGGGRVGLGELVVRGGEADLESFCLAGPALALGLGDAGQEVVPDISESAALVRGNPQERAPDTAMLMDAARAVCPAAVPERDPPALEVAEELVPLGVGRRPVFFAGPELAAGTGRFSSPMTRWNSSGIGGFQVHSCGS